MPRRSIRDLPALVEALPAVERARFNRLFYVQAELGRAAVPAPMHRLVEERFGAVGVVEQQRIVRVTNLVTLEGTSFNPLRARRPLEGRSPLEVDDEIARTRGDAFCRPEEQTTADVFGRIRGRFSVTASNIAKYDAWHGLVIFDEHNPLALGREQLLDAFDVAQRWIAAAHEQDPSAVYPFIMWNCLWKAGASIVHGHLQVTLARGLHYARIEAHRRAAQRYREDHGAEYFADLFDAHRAVGLGLERDGIRILAHLTPIKEREIILLADALSANLLDSIYGALECYRSRLGVRAFDLAVQLPPIGPVAEDWSGVPVQVRIVDRGNPTQAVSDFGATELYAASVITSDPFEVIEALEEALG